MRRVAAKWVYRSEERLLDNAVVVLTDDYVGNYYPIEDDDMPVNSSRELSLRCKAVNDL